MRRDSRRWPMDTRSEYRDTQNVVKTLRLNHSTNPPSGSSWCNHNSATRSPSSSGGVVLPEPRERTQPRFNKAEYDLGSLDEIIPSIGYSGGRFRVPNFHLPCLALLSIPPPYYIDRMDGMARAVAAGSSTLRVIASYSCKYRTVFQSVFTAFQGLYNC